VTTNAEVRRVGPLKVLLALALVAIAAMWIYAFAFAPKSSPDRLPDEAWRASAESLCAVADADLAALPQASSADSPTARATQLDDANTRLRILVNDLAALNRQPDPEDRVVRWLDDWETYLGDRARHTELLRAGEDARFAETPIEGRQTPTSLRMDAFAKVNLMPSCQVPNDIG
jgi:hypothetical protein